MPAPAGASDRVEQILQRLGDACSPTVQQFPVPAFSDNPRTKQSTWRVPRRSCVVVGVSTTESLRAALAAGLISDLMFDEATARRLLERTAERASLPR